MSMCVLMYTEVFRIVKKSILWKHLYYLYSKIHVSIYFVSSILF